MSSRFSSRGDGTDKRRGERKSSFRLRKKWKRTAKYDGMEKEQREIDRKGKNLLKSLPFIGF